jgi:hypothetical protein
MRTRTKKRLVRHLVAISVFALAFILFWIFLRYMTTDQVAPSHSGTIPHFTASRS